MYVASPLLSLRRPLGESAAAGVASAAPWLIFGVGAVVAWLVLRKPARKYVPARGSYDSLRSW